MPAPPPPVSHRFTRENARDFAARGNAVKAQRLAALRAAAQGPATMPAPDDDYPKRRLIRVRLQIDLIDQRIHALAASSKPDGQLINWLCQAQERLSDQERILDGRPLPGNLRPVAPRQSTRASALSLTLPTPSPSITTPHSAALPAPSPSADTLAPQPLPPATPSTPSTPNT